MKPAHCLSLAIDPALWLLPSGMTSLEARAMLVAIAMQESALGARRQKPSGPARSYWQFERIGVAGVLSHPSSKGHLVHVCEALDVAPEVDVIHKAIEWQDVLAAACARLLLWTLPSALPGEFAPDVAWHQYERAWRPGKPRPAKWPASYATGWQAVRA